MAGIFDLFGAGSPVGGLFSLINDGYQEDPLQRNDVDMFKELQALQSTEPLGQIGMTPQAQQARQQPLGGSPMVGGQMPTPMQGGLQAGPPPMPQQRPQQQQQMQRPQQMQTLQQLQPQGMGGVPGMQPMPGMQVPQAPQAPQRDMGDFWRIMQAGVHDMTQRRRGKPGGALAALNQQRQQLRRQNYQEQVKRQEAYQQQQQRERIAQHFEQQGRVLEATALRNGVKLPASSYQTPQPKIAPVKPGNYTPGSMQQFAESGGNFSNLVPRQPVAARGGGGGGRGSGAPAMPQDPSTRFHIRDPGDHRSATNQYRDDYRTETNRYQIAQDQYAGVQDFQPSQMTNAQDSALIKAVSKMTDPTTGVLQGEYAATAGVPAVMEWLEVAANRVMGSGQLTDRQRRELLAVAKHGDAVARKLRAPINAAYLRAADTYGIDPLLIHHSLGVPSGEDDITADQLKGGIMSPEALATANAAYRSSTPDPVNGATGEIEDIEDAERITKGMEATDDVEQEGVTDKGLGDVMPAGVTAVKRAQLPTGEMVIEGSDGEIYQQTASGLRRML